MKLKIMALFIISLLMLSMATAYESGGDFTQVGSFDRDSEPEPNFLSKLGSQLLSFTESEVSSVWQCSATTQGPIYKVSDGSVEAFGVKPGGSCDSGEFIRYYRCSDGVCTSKSDLFDHLWYKSSSSDNINYAKYYTAFEVDFWATYECYSCNLQTQVSTYTCYDSIWRGEPGTVYEGRSGICSEGCKQKTSDVETTNKFTIQDDLCVQNTQIVPPGSDGSDEPQQTVDDNNEQQTTSTLLDGTYSLINAPGKVKAGDNYKIEATFTANTAGRYYLEAGVVDQPLAVVSATGSKCDGDLHWAGEYVDLDSSEAVKMEFNLKGRDSPGKYNTIVGAYTGCLASGGRTIEANELSIEFTRDQPTVTGSATVSSSLGKPINKSLLYIGVGAAVIGAVLSVIPGALVVGIPIAAVGIGLIVSAL